MNSTQITDFNKIPCVELNAGGYTALIAYETGCNVIRLRDNNSSVDFFRFDEKNGPEVIKNSPEVWGMPTLFFPNRLADGILKTSDAEYHFPINEKNHYNNHIHGFVHKRTFKVTEHNSDSNSAWVKTKFEYNESDEFFKYFPLKFTVEYTFTLSDKGLVQDICYTNNSDRMFPLSIGSHTAMKAPFADGADPADIRLLVPAVKRCELNQRCLPTENLLELSEWDKKYTDNSMQAVLQNLDNDMYTAGRLTVNGRTFNGIIAEDIKTGKKICYEVSEDYKFWIIWNDQGSNGYFCPEPMTAMINAPNLSLSNDISGYKELAPGKSFTLFQHFYTMS